MDAAGLLRIKNLSLNHTDGSVNTSNSITMAINQYVVNLIVVGYAYNGSLAAYLAIGGKLHVLVNNLPTAVSCTLSANQFIISASSGNYGITASVLNL